MKRLALAASASLALLALTAPAVDSQSVPQFTPQPKCFYSGPQHRAFVNRSVKRLRIVAGARAQHREMLSCSSSEPQQERWKADWRAAKRALYWHREINHATPYGHWAIPEYVIACESGGSWSAYNPSGAAGPYQLMPMWNRPFPATSLRDKLAHHRIAGDLWAGGAGSGNWVCA